MNVSGSVMTIRMPIPLSGLDTIREAATPSEVKHAVPSTSVASRPGSVATRKLASNRLMPTASITATDSATTTTSSPASPPTYAPTAAASSGRA